VFSLFNFFLLAVNVSGAIYTHQQEHNCSIQPQVVCVVLVRYLIGAGTGWDTVTLLAQSNLEIARSD
jgi:hypothetical protein